MAVEKLGEGGNAPLNHKVIVKRTIKRRRPKGAKGR